MPIIARVINTSAKVNADLTFGVIKLLYSAREADLQPPPPAQGCDVVCIFGHLFSLRFLFHKLYYTSFSNCLQEKFTTEPDCAKTSDYSQGRQVFHQQTCLQLLL